MFPNLAAEIKRRGLTQKEFARKVQINENSFSRKINSKAVFNYKEITRIIGFFNPRLSLDYLFYENG